MFKYLEWIIIIFHGDDSSDIKKILVFNSVVLFKW